MRDHFGCLIVVGNAAKIVDKRRDMEGWGVYSIFKEAGRLLNQHIRILRPFILAFLLPLALVLFLEVISIAWVLASVAWLIQLVQPDHLGGILGHYHRRHSGFHAFYVGFLKAPASLQLNPCSFIINFIFHTYTQTFLLLFITWLLVSVATSAIAKAIHHIHSQPSSSFLILLHFLFHFVYRILILSLCFFVVDVFAYFILALPFYLFSGPQLFPYPLETVNIWFSYFLFLILDSWFEVSAQVAALEVY